MAGWGRDLLSIGLRAVPAAIGGCLMGFSGATIGYSLGQTADTAIGGQGEEYSNRLAIIGDAPINSGKVRNATSRVAYQNVSGVRDSNFDKWGKGSDTINSLAGIVASTGLIKSSGSLAAKAGTAAAATKATTTGTETIDMSSKGANLAADAAINRLPSQTAEAYNWTSSANAVDIPINNVVNSTTNPFEISNAGVSGVTKSLNTLNKSIDNMMTGKTIMGSEGFKPKNTTKTTQNIAPILNKEQKDFIDRQRQQELEAQGQKTQEDYYYGRPGYKDPSMLNIY